MKEKLESVLEILRKDDKLYARAMDLALESKDESRSPVERMTSLVLLSAIIEIVESELPKKPEYKWVNGAKVRVK
jgi:hypothetical protein